MNDAFEFAVPRLEGQRWSARHDRMIAGLPADGGTVIVITNEIGRELARCLRRSRGLAIRRRWRFIAARCWSDCAKLEGLSGRVFVDWTFVEHAKPEALARTRELVAQAAAIEA